MSTQRYDLYTYPFVGGEPEITCCPFGEYVLYEDHISEVKALQEEITLLKSKLNFDWNSIK